MYERYLSFLFESVKRSSDEACSLLQQTDEIGQIKKWRELFQNYVSELTAVSYAQNVSGDPSTVPSNLSDRVEVCRGNRANEAPQRYFSITAGEQRERTGHVNDSRKRAISKNASNRKTPYTTSMLGHNVNAPCFVPLRTSSDHDITSPSTMCDEVDRSVQTANGHYSQNCWHSPPVLHSQYPLPHHYHMTCAPSVLSVTSSSNLIYPGLQSNSVPIPFQFLPYPHYFGSTQPSHHSTACEESTRSKDRKRLCRSPSHSKPDNSRVDEVFTVPPSLSDHDLDTSPDHTPPFQDKGDLTSTLSTSDTMTGITGISMVEGTGLKQNLTKIESSGLEINCLDKKLNGLRSLGRDTQNLVGVTNSCEAQYDPQASKVVSSNLLADFPELSYAGLNGKSSRKVKYKLPRVKFHKKSKFSLTDLYNAMGPIHHKCYGTSKPEVIRKSQNHSSVSKASSECTSKENRTESKLYDEAKCNCRKQLHLRARRTVLYEIGQESILDEDNGWKVVKPRFRHKDWAANTCKECRKELTSRPYKSSNRTEHQNGRRHQYFHGKQSKKIAGETVANKIFDLHYKNMFVSRRFPLDEEKLKNVNCVEPKNNFISETGFSLETQEGTAYVDSDPDEGKAVLEISSTSQVIAACWTSEANVDYQGSKLGCSDSVCDRSSMPISSEGTSPDGSHNLSVSVSSGTRDNEDDSHNCHAIPGDLAIDDDHVNDILPVVEDAPDMHEEFMKYLNCSTWSTQMDEIDKFESMIACNNPADPVLMFPSVSVEQFKEFIQRHPVEAQAFRRDITFKLKKIRETENKQQQAYEKRLQLLKSKTDKVRGFVQKVEDVKQAQNKLAQERKHQIDEKLRKAEENRKNYLSIIRQKAHDEEEKLKEIAFINELEAQNRRHDFLALKQEHEERLQCIIDERQRRVEEKAAKEAAVEERRRVLEAERQEKILRIAEKRRKREEIIDRKQQERENQRLVTAREKAREREERLMARQAAQLATTEELQKRIQQKQEDSARRHEENIELIRQKALEIGLHRNLEETLSLNPVTKSEELVKADNSNSLSTVECKEKVKAGKKKRCRKLRSRMAAKAASFINDYPVLDSAGFSFGKSLHTVPILLSNRKIDCLAQDVVALKDGLSKSLKNESDVFEIFSKSRGFLPLVEIVKYYIDMHHSALDKHDLQLLVTVIDIYHISLSQGNNWSYFVLNNDIMALIDALRYSISGLKSGQRNWNKISGLQLVAVSYLDYPFTLLLPKLGNITLTALHLSVLVPLVEIITLTFQHVRELPENRGHETFNVSSRMTDVVSYIINSGLVEKMISLFQDVVMDDNCRHMNMILSCVKFFTSFIDPRYKCPELMNTLVSTDCFGTIPLLYEGLQMMGSDDLPVYIVPITELLLKFAELDILLFQDTLGDDTMALQVRAIASNLMCFCDGKPREGLLQTIIQLVGYFAIKNVKNQTLLQSGQQPTVLQRLVTLPFIFFCDNNYNEYLFPTLFVCSFNNQTNKQIVENELSYCHLEDYVNSERGKKNKMIQMFYAMNENP